MVILAKKQLAVRLDEEIYKKIEKCQQELKKKKLVGGQSLGKCGEYLIGLGLDSFEKSPNP